MTHLGDGKASLQFDNVDVKDWITVPNSFSNGMLLGGPAAASMSLKIEWSDVTRRVTGFSDATNGFGGDFFENKAKITVSTKNSDGSFTFAGSGDTFTGPTKCFAQIGQMQNGVFFNNGG